MLITANTVVHDQTVKMARLLVPPMLILMFLITVKTGSQVFKNVLLYDAIPMSHSHCPDVFTSCPMSLSLRVGVFT